jgi:hypothetical protein
VFDCVPKETLLWGREIRVLDGGVTRLIRGIGVDHLGADVNSDLPELPVGADVLDGSQTLGHVRVHEYPFVAVPGFPETGSGVGRQGFDVS